MTTPINTLIRKSFKSSFRLALVGTLAAGATFLAATDDPQQAHAGHTNEIPAKLVEVVRNATRQFIDVNAATATGYRPAFGCV